MPGGDRRARKVALLGGAIYLGIVVIFLASFSGRIEWFVKFGETSPYTPYARSVLGPDISVPLDDGHDGQAFWLQARDPFLTNGEQLRAIYERPAYRAQRMLYPLAASPGHLFGEQGVLWALVLVNLGAVVFGCYLCARLAEEAGARDRAAWAYAANPVVFIAVLMDFADALALALLLATVLAARRERWWWALAAAVGAVLTKEINLIGIAALAVLGTGVPRRWRVALIAAPAAAAGTWALYARWRLGWPASDIQEFTPIPFYGYWDAYRRGWSQYGNWSDAFMAVIVVVFAGFSVRRWLRRRTFEMNTALPFLALVPFMSIYVTDIMLNLVRAVGPAITLVAIDAYVPKGRRKVTPSKPGNSR